MTKEKIYQTALEQIESHLCANDFRAGVSAMQIIASKALAAAARLPPEPKAELGLQDALGRALRELFDEQNGPPLETRRSQWETARENARMALQWYDASIVRAQNRQAEPKASHIEPRVFRGNGPDCLGCGKTLPEHLTNYNFCPGPNCRDQSEPSEDADVPTDLRWCIKADAQACEEIAIGDEPLSQKQIDELAERARRLIANLAHYRRQLNREAPQE